jgi:hypothetical protein
MPFSSNQSLTAVQLLYWYESLATSVNVHCFFSCGLSLHISATGRELHDGHRSFTFMPNASSLSSGACCYKPRSWVDLGWTCCIPQWVAANKTWQLNLWYKYVNILLQCGQDRPWALQGLVVHIVLVIWHSKCRTFILPQCRSGNFTLFVTCLPWPPALFLIVDLILGTFWTM